MTKREFLDTVFALAPNEANAIMDAFDEYVESNVVPTGRSGKERRMSKYIIELDDRIKLVTSVGVTENGVVYTTSDYVHNLEELNSDYINEHYGQLQDEAYQRGLEDGKNNVENGCEGCKYESISGCEQPCCKCKRGCMDFYDPMSKDDRIEVGDEVDWNGDCFVVTRIYQPLVDKRCNGIAKDGSVYMDVVYDRLTKTGKHYDIASILEAMRE